MKAMPMEEGIAPHGRTACSAFDEDEPEPLLLTAAQVAQLLQLSLRTLWRLRSGHKLPSSVKQGATVRWRRDEVLELIADSCPPLDVGAEGL